MQFAGATTSDGSCSETGGVVSCDIGTIEAHGAATVTIEVGVTLEGNGSLTNIAVVSGNEPDSLLDDNIAIEKTTALARGMSVRDVVVAERSDIAATFTLTLNRASAQPVTVNYATLDGTAVAGNDYVAKSGTVTFPPGGTRRSLRIRILKDWVPEPAESFRVKLSGITGAVLFDDEATGWITERGGPRGR